MTGAAARPMHELQERHVRARSSISTSRSYFRLSRTFEHMWTPMILRRWLLASGGSGIGHFVPSEVSGHKMLYASPETRDGRLHP